MSARGITLVGASAGSGKTYRITQELTAAVGSANDARIPLESVMAVTYTRKAHGELAARIRQKLVTEGSFDEAMRLPLSYVGTVHAICLRLLQEFALDAGLSPHVDVAVDDQSRLLREALEASLPVELRARLAALAQRLELRHDPQRQRYDWQTPVEDIMELARANRIAASELPGMAARSLESLLALLPAPEQDGPALDNALTEVLLRTTAELGEKADGTAITDRALDRMRDCARRLQDDELTWSQWAKLATLETSKPCRDVVAPLQRVAARYESHPRFHDDLRVLTSTIFEAAAHGLVGYRVGKERRRVVDYVDMLDGTLRLLENPRVRAALEERLRFLVVDEFQDTSPIQLALFLELHRCSKRSVWVGDSKQCIFEYAGADPLLMDAVSTWVEQQGGTLDRLQSNYRSRPELVRFCSELFVHALAPHGFARAEIEVAPARPGGALRDLPPLGVFRLEAANKDEVADAIAAGVARMLGDPDSTPVLDVATKQRRAVRPGDIAVLVATNAEAALVAGALHRRGIRAALAREGLLGTPEGTLADSALRWLIDKHDSLAAAKIDALLGFDGHGADAWLTDRLQAKHELDNEAPDGWRSELSRLREQLPSLSPSEALHRALDALDALELCARWPDPSQRRANLDALRGLAGAYEQRCTVGREAATVVGLVRYFDALREPRLHRDEMLAADHQHVSTDERAVNICTYHKAKGLEWPVVVLASLERGERRNAFEVSPESERSEFDPERPLEGRWIRYWPWPLGTLRKAPLADAAEQSMEGKRVAAREEKERARLLYVGFTRARDHLVLAARGKVTNKGFSANTTWLDSLADAQGGALLALPLSTADGSDGTIRVGSSPEGLRVPARVWHLDGNPARARDAPAGARAAASVALAAETTRSRWFQRSPREAAARPAYLVTPSVGLDWPELAAGLGDVTLGAVERLPQAIHIQQTGIDHQELGNAVHAFLAADLEHLSPEERLHRARRLLEGAHMASIVRPESLVAAGDHLRTWVNARWPAATWRRELPIHSALGSAHGVRRVSGIIDLLLEQGDDCILIDHKSFPGASEAAWRSKCREFIPQLAAYAELVRRVNGKRVSACWVHLPIGGAMLELRMPEEKRIRESSQSP